MSSAADAADESGALRFRVAACCTDCAGEVKATLSALPGARDVEVLPGANVITVRHDGRLDVDSVRSAAARHNLTLVNGGNATQASDVPWWRDRFVLTMAFATCLLGVTLLAEHVLRAHTVATVAGFATVAVGGARYLREAAAATRARRVAFVQLLVVAVVGAVALGVVEEAAMLVVVYSLGEILETWVAQRARRSLRSLMDLVPTTARRRLEDGGDEVVAVLDLAVGDTVLVRPGERLPTDGIVAAGASAVDQSSVTGESIPVEVTPGHEVFGGTVNGHGALEIVVSRPYEDTTLARVIRQVEDAQANKSSVQRFAERFGARYTPVVALIAVAVAIIGPLATGDVSAWLYRAMVVLVVACSCCLLISVPTAVVAAVTRGARDGILIRGGAFLEALAEVKTVAFDKTGTLTRGRPRVTSVVSLNGLPDRDVLRLAAAVEAASEHPLAGAVLAAAREQHLSWPHATAVVVEPGVGVRARIGDDELFLGRPDAFQDAGDGLIAALQQQGKTVIALARRGELLGLLAVADELRPDALDVVARLHAAGVERVVMLTGDNAEVARATSRQAGIDDYRANLLPEHKSRAVAEVRERHGALAMVGDGINDAPALAVADVGIAMGASGSTVALETADVALMADELAKLPDAVALARRAMRTVRENVTLSLVTIAALVTAAVAGWLTLTTGLLLNEGSALLIIANGLRLLRHRPGPALAARGRSSLSRQRPGR